LDSNERIYWIVENFAMSAKLVISRTVL